MMTIDDMLGDGTPPIVAILRGLEPDEAIAVAGALVAAGIRLIEVPLNSPDPFRSIAMIQAEFVDRALIGGGTVIDVDQVGTLAQTGCRFMVSPNTDPDVISHGIGLGLEAMPGFVTPSEAFQAIRAGARRLKFFPASILGTDHVHALREVLPHEVGIWAVGGTGADTIASWLTAGAEGIGVGSALFKPGDDGATVGDRARELVAAWRAISA